jgi:hypothetical protein
VMTGRRRRRRSIAGLVSVGWFRGRRRASGGRMYRTPRRGFR